MAITVDSRAEARVLGGTWRSFLDVLDHLELLRMLVIKDLKIKYKASAIGLLWSLLNPLLMMLVYSAIFGAVIKSPRPQFPIFIMAGLLPWNFFATSIQPATLSIVGSAALVKKTRFPNALLPLSIVISGFINFLISMVLLFGLLAFYRHPLGVSIVALPVLLVSELLFIGGLSLLLSSLNVLFRDIEHFLGILLTVWFFATPILYPRSAIQNPLASTVLGLNPMTWLIEGYQAIFYGVAQVEAPGRFAAGWPQGRLTLAFCLLSVALFVVGFLTFARLSRRFGEEV